MAILKNSTFHGVISTANGLTTRQANAYKSLVTKRLSLDNHHQLGQLLNEARVNADYTRRRWIDDARCLMDDIVQCEHPASDVISIYYPGNPPTHGGRAQAKLYLFCWQLWNTPALQHSGYDPRYRTVFGYIQGKLAKYPQR